MASHVSLAGSVGGVCLPVWRVKTSTSLGVMGSAKIAFATTRHAAHDSGGENHLPKSAGLSIASVNEMGAPGFPTAGLVAEMSEPDLDGAAVVAARRIALARWPLTVPTSRAVPSSRAPRRPRSASRRCRARRTGPR